MTDRSNVQLESRAETLLASPDKVVKVRDLFGVDSDMEVPAFSEPDERGYRTVLSARTAQGGQATRRWSRAVPIRLCHRRLCVTGGRDQHISRRDRR